jgi:hypothetical protein
MTDLTCNRNMFLRRLLRGRRGKQTSEQAMSVDDGDRESDGGPSETGRSVKVEANGIVDNDEANGIVDSADGTAALKNGLGRDVRSSVQDKDKVGPTTGKSDAMPKLTGPSTPPLPNELAQPTSIPRRPPPSPLLHPSQ